jgi:hypothetical protein
MASGSQLREVERTKARFFCPCMVFLVCVNHRRQLAPHFLSNARPLVEVGFRGCPIVSPDTRKKQSHVKKNRHNPLTNQKYGDTLQIEQSDAAIDSPA